ncbi:hypothetical protein V8E51_009607 [Hyaloscypha variabilis]
MCNDEFSDHVHDLTFTLLPLELREKIWIFAHPKPRNVTFSTATYQQKPSYKRTLTRFAHLLANHESRCIFLEHYHPIFIGFPNSQPKGMVGGSYFNYEKRFALHCLRLARSSYLDIALDGHAEDTFTFRDMADLKLVTLREIIPRHQLRSFSWHYWPDWRSTAQLLQRVLEHRYEEEFCGRGQCVKLAMHYIWTRRNGEYISRGQRHEAFLSEYTDEPSEDILERWKEMKFFGPDGTARDLPVVAAGLNVFSREVEINLHGKD